MRTALVLGVRLAFSTHLQRLRSLAVVLACAIGVAFLLTVCGVAVDQLVGNTAFAQRQITYLIAGAVLIVTLPVLALLSTVGRLSASMRDLRLANLRILGMSASQTRAVAAAEVGIASVTGAVLGVLVHLLCVLVIPSAAIAPGWALVSVLVAVPVAVVLIGLLPQRTATQSALARSRRAASSSPGGWRTAPLVVGLALCGWTHWQTVPSHDSDGSTVVTLSALFLGVALVGIGVLLVVPVFTGLMGAAVLRISRGPRAILLGRRLLDQPAAMSRVVATLMVGLFAVVMARAVLSAFLATGQYESAADHIERDQTVEFTVAPGEAEGLRARLAGVASVDRIVHYPIVRVTWGDYDANGDGGTGLVARCADLAAGGRPLAHCSDTHVNAVGKLWFSPEAAPAAEAQAVRDWEPVGPRVPVDLSFGRTPIPVDDFDRAVGALEGTSALVLSPDLPAVADLLSRSAVLVVAHAGPGDQLYDQVEAAGLKPESFVDIENYRFVQGMQRLIWVVAVTVLSVGLLAFTVAAVDRAVARRRELTALRLIGTPAGLLRWTQWCEAAIPTAFGSLLALGSGAAAGSSYLQLDDRIGFPVRAAVLLSATALVVAAALAAITVLGTSSRLDPEHIRTQ